MLSEITATKQRLRCARTPNWGPGQFDCVPGRGTIRLWLTDARILKASAEESLHACQDCLRREQQIEYDAERKVHIVALRSLT
jgi:hypothetical protein